MGESIDVVQFELEREQYALDIQLAREIVEMMPITPIPRAPPYLAGIINLRGEITTILDLRSLLGFQKKDQNNGQKIIVLVPEAAQGANVGVIVDDVKSVIQVAEKDIEKMGGAISSELSSFVKGIIKLNGAGEERVSHQKKVQKNQAEADTKQELVIWLDMQMVLNGLVQMKAN